MSKPAHRRIRIDAITVPPNRRPVGDTKDLTKSIKELGLLNPITVTEDLTLVAGLHRLRACEAIDWKKIPATVVSLDELHIELAELDENLERNELSYLERAEALLRRKRIYERLNPDSRAGVIGGKAKAATEAGSATEIISFSADTARRAHLSPRTVQHEVHVAEAIPSDVRKVLKDTPVADRKVDLLRLARMPHDEQRDLAQRLSSGAARTVKEAERQATHEKVADGVTPYPNGKFEVLVVDPPWPYDKGKRSYPAMTLDEIGAVPVEVLAAEDAVVLLWVPPTGLAAGVTLLKGWGFRQAGFVVWAKTNALPGQYLMSMAELCLLGVRGNPEVLKPRPNVITAPTRQHSRKPDEFYGWVEEAFGGRRVDLFARESRVGWETWGPERSKFDHSRR